MDNMESTVQIIPYYAHPHVHSVINDNTWYDETVAPTVNSDDMPFATCIVTGADMGIDNTFVRLNDLATKQALFGKGNYQRYGQPSIQADVLFNGSTNVWFCRVLPDNATYANVVVLAHYRKGKILDELSQETGKVRLEVKFSLAYANKPYIVDGAKDEDTIEEFARSLTVKNPDPQTGYMTVPICFIRSIGRGKYGNNYSISITRDSDAEKEYDLKMYKFNLISNDSITRVTNVFSGSLFQTTRYEMSTMISDVIDQFSTGSAPIRIESFEDSFQTLYNFYKKIVAENSRYVVSSGMNEDDVAELKVAEGIIEDSFDPLFGMLLNTRSNERIPYYRNYTTRSTGAYVQPDLVVPRIYDVDGPIFPLNIADWNAAFIGARVLMVADRHHDGKRWMYTVTHIDPDTGNITYNEGEECQIDDDQYDGVNLSLAAGNMLSGGHDGDFQEITVNGETREPNESEMKILLSREFVKAFRGTKDRKILSPARVNLDFMFDANYNMTNDNNLELQDLTYDLFSNSTILTSKDTQNLAILGSSNPLEFADLNVKRAMYDLNEFRNRNGMTVNPEHGAGCSLYLDCNFVGMKNIGINYELMDVINMMAEFEGRATSIDLGYYEIFDPTSRKRVKVTVAYYIAKNLIPHIMKYGLNKPFVYNFASLRAIQRDTTMTASGDMIRDTFRPDIDLIDWDVKEKLYNSRINYYLTTDEGRTVQRAVQNTRQTDASALLEENNVRVLNTLKKGLEKACRGYLYEWNEPEVRKGYTQAQMEVYRPWIGTMVQDLEINFTANEWEQERMIMHCYCAVKFRDIVKRIILEINIQRPTYSTGGEE